MRDRHPPPVTEDTARRKLLPIALVCLPAAPSLTLVQGALLSLAPISTARPPNTKKGSLLTRYRNELMPALHAVVGIMAEGNVPGPPILSWIARASTALMEEDHSHVTRYLRPSQQGFGTKNGCVSIVHTIRRWLRKHDNYLQSAFNQIDQSCFLQEIRRAALGLVRYCDLCCSSDTSCLVH